MNVSPAIHWVKKGRERDIVDGFVSALSVFCSLIRFC